MRFLPRIRRLIALLALALASVLGAASGAWSYPFQPNERFQTLLTAHFRITYPAEERFNALQVAIVAEDAFAALTAAYQWTPRGPIDVILTDRTDLSNGSSSTSPLHVVRLFMSPPHPDDRLDYFDDWLRLLVFHEMTHAIHLDEVRCLSAGLRTVFGRIPPLGHFQPIGQIEGNAVMQETVLTTRGRGRSPHSMMLLRMAALGDKWPTIDQFSVSPNAYPGGAVPYIWGGLFNLHLYEQFGMEKIAEYHLMHAGQPWPFLFNHNARVVFGTHLDDLYTAWTVNMKRMFREQADAITAQGLTPARRLTRLGQGHDSPVWLSEWELAYFERTRERTPSLRRVDVREAIGHDRRIGVTYATRGATIDAEGAIVYADVKPYDRWHTVFDLWRQARGHSPQRLTTGARVYDPAAIPGRDAVLVVSERGGRTGLAEYDLSGRLVREWISPDAFEGAVQFSTPAIHPSGRWAAVSVWHEDGNRDLFRLDFADGSLIRLTADRERDIWPAFDPSGRYLVFSSGRSGVFNLYALDLQTDDLYQITNVLGGAFQPAIDPTGRWLAFIGYNTDGYDVYVMDFSPAAWRPVARETVPAGGVVVGPIVRDIMDRARALEPPTLPYRAYRTAWPHYWFPSFAFSSTDFWLGAQTAGGDIAGYHAWSAEALWGFNRRFPLADATYTWSRWTPALQLRAAHLAENHGRLLRDDRDRVHTYWERRVEGEATVSYPLYWRHAFYTGYIGQWRDNLDPLPEHTDAPPFEGYWSGVRVGYQYAMNQALGRYLEFPFAVGATFYDRAFGGEVDQQLIGGQAGVFVPFPWRDVGLYGELRGAASFGDLLTQRTFRLGGFSQNPPYLADFTRDRFALPGYLAGVARGDRAGVAHGDFRFPVWEIERGISTWPVFFRQVRGVVSGDAGAAFDRDHEPELDDLYPSTGLDLFLDATVAYSFAASFQASMAYGFRDRDDTGGFRWFVTLNGLLP